MVNNLGLEKIDIEKYDFLDVGASKGGSIEFAKNKLGGKSGLGIDIDHRKVEYMIKSGYDCIHGDVTKIDLPENSFRFVVMSHMLEHLPNYESALQIINRSIYLASDFVYIQGPYFDADDYLQKLGLKFYWSDWPAGHTYHITTTDLLNILEEIETPNFELLLSTKIKNSAHTTIHPIASPHSQQYYDESIHPPKEKVSFSKPVFREMVCLIKIKNNINYDFITSARADMHLFNDGQNELTK